MSRHRWGDKIHFPLAGKSECECKTSGIVKVSRHEHEGGRDVYWTEFWCGGERVDGTGTPKCIGSVAYSASHYPL